MIIYVEKNIENFNFDFFCCSIKILKEQSFI